MGVRRGHTGALIGLTALIAAAGLAGCSSSGAKDASSSGDGGSKLAVAGAAPEAAAGPAKDAVAKQPAQAPDLRVDQRAIVYTGSITVRVKSVDEAAAKATAIAAGAAGFVGGDKRSSGTDAANATLVLRVPAARFSSVVDQLARLGTEEQRGISTDDVTEETIDLDARIATQQARVDSGRKLLAQAKSLTDLVMLEREVATRESDLASLTAKKRHLADLTALSTITVVLLSPQAAVQAAGHGPGGFLGGLRGGWHALVASLAVLLTVLGALLPWLIALGLPVWAVTWLLRRYGRRVTQRRASSTPAFAGVAPATTPAPPSPGDRPTS